MQDTNKIIVVGRILPDSNKLHQNQEVYSEKGIMSTLKGTAYKDPPKVIMEVAANK